MEKTAKFISSQGPQMEILLKTKQAANAQFEFLNHDGQYNSYYKHILMMMKANTYPWQDTIEKSEENSGDAEDFNMNGGSPSPVVMAPIIIPKIAYKPSADCAYTQLISKITKAPIAEIEKQQRQQEDMQSNGGASSSASNVEVVKKPSALLGLVHYSSDSDSDEDEVIVFNGLMPPSELQLVIDKTASYVAKNGVEFEETLRKKRDKRFEFLDTTNEFNHYYAFKVNENRGTPQTITAPITRKPKEEAITPKAPPAPVCFSIKPKEEKSQLKPAVLQVSSDDENKTVPKTPTPPRLTTVEEELELQVDAMNAEREERLAKEKLSDKLLNRVRLGMLPKEKMLQIERKKKALMFINQIKGESLRALK